MTNKELIELLSTFPMNAEVLIGVEILKEKPGYTFFDPQVTHYEEVWSYGNASPRLPSVRNNAIVIEIGWSRGVSNDRGNSWFSYWGFN